MRYCDHPWMRTSGAEQTLLPSSTVPASSWYGRWRPTLMQDMDCGMVRLDGAGFCLPLDSYRLGAHSSHLLRSPSAMTARVAS